FAKPTPVVQRTPARFVTSLTTEKIEAGQSGYAPWNTLHKEMLKYAEIGQENLVARDASLKAMNAVSSSWMLGFSRHRARQIVDGKNVDEKEEKRNDFVRNVVPGDLAAEQKEIAETTGGLDTKADNVAADPSLSRKFEEADTGGGVFKQNTDIKDEAGKKI